mgnify:CR=1 FL=1
MAVGFSDTDYKQDIPVNLGIRGRPVMRSVLIDSGARDGGIAGGASATELLPGTVLAPITASSRFSDFDNDASDGTEAEGDSVILMEKVTDISTGHQRALIASGGGSFNWDKLRWRLSGDKSAYARADAPFAFYNAV